MHMNGSAAGQGVLAVRPHLSLTDHKGTYCTCFIGTTVQILALSLTE
jgi:hypothetical protein